MAHSLSYSLSFPSSVFFFQSTLIFLFLSFLQILYLEQTILGIQEKARSDDRIDEADKLARFDYYWWTRCHVRELDCSRESYNSDHRYRCRYSEMRLEKQTFESHIQSLC
ncbi:uncharacterized protein LOC143149196 isoform X2 [Ptiloglossa arizonensis]|uniref:uncharacterized protein LOC143149196 isoform X2 n=1 Tax=Ptiloglossa arizonensis TaxID=3350558 RepID=UPI003F9FEBC8